MGKPFRKEIEELKETYDWACSVDVSQLAKTIGSTWDSPLLAVGSGGSYSIAEFHANLHRRFFESNATAITPMELISALPKSGKASVWFLSASGNNIDIRRAFQHAALHEPKAVSAIVGRENSKLSSLNKKYQYTNLFEFAFPCGKDGFLATNSILAFSILLYRAYCVTTQQQDKLEPTLSEFINNRTPDFQTTEQILKKSEELWHQDVVHVLYSPTLKAAAFDIESKFIEAGLGSIHLADLRNFAHGRHHWFAKNTTNCGILALTTPNNAELTKKTLALLPEDIPKVAITIDDINGSGALVGLLLSIYFTNSRGGEKNIDPGKPSVPPYGSKIYNLTANAGFTRSIPKTDMAIRRKIRKAPKSNKLEEEVAKHCQQFIKKLSKQKFGAIVLDYDNTIVDSRHRGYPPTNEICQELVRLLKIGIKVGFATGRGKSIRCELQSPGVIPSQYWDKVFIGYYNGSEIGVLSNDIIPNKTNCCTESLKKALNFLQKNTFISSLEYEITERTKQVSILPKINMGENFLWEVASSILSQEELLEIGIFRSSHSIDIISSNSPKLALVQKFRATLLEGIEILTIGDRGRWPGNDATLLNQQFSLSVDEVSFSTDNCWNLCSAGIKGPQGTLDYLKRLKGEKGIVYFK